MFAKPQSKKLGGFSLFDVRMVCAAFNTECASIKFLKSLPHITHHKYTHTHTRSASIFQIKIPRDLIESRMPEVSDSRFGVM